MRTSVRLPLALLAFVLAGGCDGGATPPETRVAAQLGVVSGDAQTATVGQALPQPLTVQVLDDRGDPMPGQTIAFTVTAGGGSVDAASAVTDAEGKAATRWTLGMAADTQRVLAQLTRADRPPLTAGFRARGSAAAPATVQRFGVAAPAGPAGAVMADPRSVRVLDTFGNPVPGVPVTWQVTAGGGTVTPQSATTGPDGVATATWTLGPRWGAVHQLRATTSVGTIDFAANATLPPDAVIQAAGGSGQTGTAGAPLADSVTARVLLADGRPLQGVVIEWLVASGQGTVSPVQGTTDDAGRVRARWTLPGTVGPASIAARVLGAGGTVHFTATAVAGQPSSLEAVGAAQHTGPAGEPLAQTVAVRVRDAFGNPVPGVAVAWQVTAGGGAVAPRGAATDASGVAQAGWTLGPRIGAVHQLRAATPAGAVDFAAAATLPPGAVIQAVAGSGLEGTAGAALADSVTARVLLADGRPLQGVAVEWVAEAGQGTVAPSRGITGEAGRVRARWTLPEVAGPASIAARVVSAGGAVHFTATAAPGQPSSLEAVGAARHTGPAGEPLAQTVAVRVRDAFGNPVPGVAVSWQVVGGGGAVAVTPAAADGVSAARWTLGPVLGAVHQLRAAGAGGTVDFSATATLPPGVMIQAESGSGQTGTVATALPAPLVARVLLADGRPLQGAPVQWVAGAGSGSVAPAQGVTAATGRVSAQWLLPTQPGAVVAQARVAPAGPAAPFTATATAGTPRRLDGIPGVRSVVAGDGVDLQVRVVDASGNPVPGAAVRWEPEPGAGTPRPATSLSDASGIAATRWVPNTRAGYQKMFARSDATGDTAYWRVNVLAGEVTQVVFRPSLLALSGPGDWAEPVAYAGDRYGNRRRDLAMTLRLVSSDTSVVTVSPEGRDFDEGWFLGVTAAGNGTATITGTIPELGVTGTLVVTVGPRP